MTQLQKTRFWNLSCIAGILLISSGASHAGVQFVPLSAVPIGMSDAPNNSEGVILVQADDIGPDGLKRRGDGTIDDTQPGVAAANDDIGQDGLKRRGDGTIDDNQLGRPKHADRADRGERPERAERDERAERTERAERPERVERPQRAERPEKVERGERVERAERANRD